MWSQWRHWKSYFSWHGLNPLNWSVSEVKMFLLSFFVIMLPVYLFIGLQPALPADAAEYPQLEISDINLKTPVQPTTPVDHELPVPSTIAAVYQPSASKTFIFGHASTVFKKLPELQIGDTFTYEEKSYQITKLQTIPKAEIDMSILLQEEPIDTVIMMTCAGEPLPNQDATHRLIITAIPLSES